jgi:hypothetical protein
MYFYDAQGFYNKSKCIEGFFNNFGFTNSSPPSSQPPEEPPAQPSAQPQAQPPAQPPAQPSAQPPAQQQAQQTLLGGVKANINTPPAQPPAQQPAQQTLLGGVKANINTPPPPEEQPAQPPAQQRNLLGVNVAVEQTPPAQQPGFVSTNVQIPNLKDVVVLGKLGMSPWGKAPGFLDKEAQWIWFTPNANKSAPGSANASFIYTYNNTSSSNISAKINIIVDNKSSIIVNDKNIGEQKGGWGGSGGLFNVTLQPGTNDFVFNAANVGKSPNPAGLLVSVLNKDNTVLFRTGDNGWKYLPSQQSAQATSQQTSTTSSNSSQSQIPLINLNPPIQQASNQNLNNSILSGYVTNLVSSRFNELNKSNEDTNRIVNMKIYTLKDPEVFIINDETKANSYDKESSKIFRVFYKPKLEKSKILIEISSYYDINGTHDDKFECEINVSEDKNHYTNTKGGKRIAIRKIRFEKNIGGGARSGSFFPSGVFDNNNNKPKYFHFNVKREGSDDRFKLARGKNSKFLDVEGLIKITEIKTSK